jgi:predicted kinase
MIKAIIGIGIPGSGKSTILKRFAEKNNYIYICPDDIRFELTGDSADQTKNKEVWELAHKRAEEALGRNRSIVFDATFTVGPQRRDFIQKLKTWGANKISGIYLDTGLEIAKQRNNERERKVPEFVLDRMHIGLQDQSPDLTDGFDSVFTLDENQNIKEVNLKYQGKELRKLS